MAADNESVNDVAFDILLKADAAPDTASLATIEALRPEPEEIERCRRWLVTRGVNAHSSGFGISCTAPAPVFEALFNVKVEFCDPLPGQSSYRIVDGSPDLPKEIADMVDQVTLSVTPEFF